jgi:hypothetical protein
VSRPHTKDAVLLTVISTIAVLALNGVGLLVGHTGITGTAAASSSGGRAPGKTAVPSASAGRGRTAKAGVPATLPGGRSTVFGGHRFLVAYYGTAGTGALGVLGKGSPERMQRRLARAGRAFARPGRPVQLVDELIVSIADRRPGKDGDYSHDLTRAQVEPYLRAAHRSGALLLLDIQTGHSDFLTIAKRWRWALADPWVGLALDPEWRMSHHDVPGQVIGHVGAAEINRTSAWLAHLVAARHLPQKLFVVHQFRGAMIRHIDRVQRRPGLAMVQHVDGFGTPRDKKATFHAVVRPRRFTLGFKLFYQVDVHRMSARQVFALRPTVRFVSYQ